MEGVTDSCLLAPWKGLDVPAGGLLTGYGEIWYSLRARLEQKGLCLGQGRTSDRHSRMGLLMALLGQSCLQRDRGG